LIYIKDGDGGETFYKYDNKGNQIYQKTGNYEKWDEYDKKGNLIHSKTSQDYEEWNKYDDNGKLVYKQMNSHGLKSWKEYEYDKKGNLIHEKDSDKNEYWYEYDGKGNLIYGVSGYGNAWWHENAYHPNGKLKKVITWNPS